MKIIVTKSFTSKDLKRVVNSNEVLGTEDGVTEAIAKKWIDKGVARELVSKDVKRDEEIEALKKECDDFCNQFEVLKKDYDALLADKASWEQEKAKLEEQAEVMKKEIKALKKK